jgi:hypothetical protein
MKRRLEAPIQVSIISVIANPEKYKNKTVGISGYYYVDMYDESTRYLFLSREYASLYDLPNAISLPKEIDNTKRSPSVIYTLNEPTHGWKTICSASYAHPIRSTPSDAGNTVIEVAPCHPAR